MSDATASFEKAVLDREAPSDGKQNDRSTIEFPYLDLDVAVEVAKAIYARAGLGSCEIDELAAQMSQTLSGAFRAKTATAKIFGVVEKDDRTSFKLSPIGQKIVRQETEPEGRASAFLTIPLYKAVFDRYRGHLLPPAKALEREMTVLGVAPKQADKARQAFERSAKQAGFFAHGEDRLVHPRIDRPIETRPIEAADELRGHYNVNERRGGAGGDSGGLDLDPLLIALLRMIPAKSEGWPKERRLRWFRTFAMNVSQVYDDDNSAVDLEIKINEAAGL